MQSNGDETETRFSRNLFYFWADRPGLQIAVLCLLSAIAVVGYVRPSFFRDLLIAGREASGEPIGLAQPVKPGRKPPPPDVEPFEVADGECVIVASADDFFTTANLTAIRAVADELEALPQVSRILWLDNIPSLNLFGLRESLLPRSTVSARQLRIARERTLNNPLAVGQLISADGKTLLLHVRIDWFYATTDESCTTDLRAAAASAAAGVPGSNIRFQVTGAAPLHLMMVNNHVRDAWRYQLTGYGIMIVAALVLFRGFSAVSIVAIAPACGVFWTMGMLRLFDFQDNPFNDVIVPVLISLVGLADSVHMMVEIRNQRSAGHDVRTAARRGVARVGLACVLTSVTTAIGFASLGWAHHEVVREFGSSCVLGVTMTLISVLTVVPLGCRSPLGKRLHVGLGKSLVDGQLRRIDALVAAVLRHDRRMSWVAIAATIALAGVCTWLTPDERRYSGLSDSGEAAQALRQLDRSLGGLEFSYIDVSWNDAADEARLLTVLDEIHALLEEEPLIGQPLGVRELLASLPGDGPPAERFTLLELLPDSLKRAFYQPEQGRAFVQFRVQDIGIARYGPVFERLEAGLERITMGQANYQLSLYGDAVWRWRNIYQILTDLAASLGTASFVIWIILTVVYRSIRIGLISIVPNVFPLVATGATLVFTGQYLELVTVCVFTICIGIAVDDTIHFLTRYREESTRGGDHAAIIRRAFTGVGSALLMTTIVLVAGMLTAALGDARDARLFGIMGALTLSTALFADVVFLPALLSWLGPGDVGGDE